MSVRELVVLGTASQAPTRYRNHNGYLLRWDGEGILFDPGEGTQRQLLLAGVPAPQITRVCITHFHGDHCLGLPGIIQRLSLDRVTRPVMVHFPAQSQPYFDRLRHAAIFHETTPLHPNAVAGDGLVSEVPGPPGFRLVAATLDHGAPTLGWRLEEPDAQRMLPDRLAAFGIDGPDVRRLQRDGRIVVGRRSVRLEDVSAPRRGQRFAFVMDTRLCDAAFALAEGADMLVCESTFLRSEADLARTYGHLTAADAARIASEAGARLLVLTHFSQRHPDESVFVNEAKEVFPNVVAAQDLARIPVPRRRPSPSSPSKLA